MPSSPAKPAGTPAVRPEPNPLAARLRADGPAGIDLRGTDLRDQDLSSLDLSGADLTGAHLNGADLSNAALSFCKLQGAHLQGAKLDGSELLGSDLSDADLTECSALRTGLGGATLAGATFTSACLSGATLSRAKASGARFAGANLAGARFYDADLRSSTVRGLIGVTKADWIGVDTRDVNFRGAHLIRRHIEDENYLHELRNQSRANALLYQLWWLTSDCGRSFTRWAGFTGLLAIVFAAAYGFVAIDFGPNETPLSPLYFSVVTLTTLGYGDALPVSVEAQLVVMAEVIIGYMARGGLLSVFAAKRARRAE